MQCTAERPSIRVIVDLAIGVVIPLVLACSHRPPDVGAAAAVAGGTAEGAPTYLPSEVDKQATADPDNPLPRYQAPPNEMRAQIAPMRGLPGARGTVEAAFVIDTTGCADMSTFKVIHSDNDIYAPTVQLAVRLSHFSPAEKDGRPVREWLTTRYVNGDLAVDKGATPRQPIPFPRYPPRLQTAGIVGTVVVAFLIDTTGHIGDGTFTIIRSDNDAFTRAVEETVPSETFYPAEKGGRRVKVVVATPITFNMRNNDMRPPDMSGRGIPGRPGSNEPQ